MNFIIIWSWLIVLINHLIWWINHLMKVKLLEKHRNQKSERRTLWIDNGCYLLVSFFDVRIEGRKKEKKDLSKDRRWRDSVHETNGSKYESEKVSKKRSWIGRRFEKERSVPIVSGVNYWIQMEIIGEKDHQQNKTKLVLRLKSMMCCYVNQPHADTTKDMGQYFFYFFLLLFS